MASRPTPPRGPKSRGTTPPKRTPASAVKTGATPAKTPAAKTKTPAAQTAAAKPATPSKAPAAETPTPPAAATPAAATPAAEKPVARARARATATATATPAKPAAAKDDAKDGSAVVAMPLRAVPDAPEGKDMDSSATETATEAGDAASRIKRGDLLNAVAERTSLKRGDVRIVMELVLEELGNLLDANDEVVLPPLGKAMVKKRQGADDKAMLTLKLKRLPRQDG